MKTIELYDEPTMRTFHVYIHHIIKLRETEQKTTEIYLADSSIISSKQPLDVIKNVIDNAK